MVAGPLDLLSASVVVAVAVASAKFAAAIFVVAAAKDSLSASMVVVVAAAVEDFAAATVVAA